MNRVLFAGLVTFLILTSSAHASCWDAVTQRAPELQDGLNASQWRSVFRYAKSIDDEVRGAYALINLLLLHKRELGLSRRSALALEAARHFYRNYGRAVAITKYQEDPSPETPHTDFAGQPVSLGGILKNKLKRGAEHLVWSWLPFGYRSIPRWIAMASIGHLSRQLIDRYNWSSFYHTLGVSRSFARKVLDLHLIDTRNLFWSIFRDNRKLFVAPLNLYIAALVGSVFLDFHWINPSVALANELHPHYAETRFIEDVASEVGGYDGKKIFIIRQVNYFAESSNTLTNIQRLTGMKIDDSADPSINDKVQLTERGAIVKTVLFEGIDGFNSAIESVPPDTDIVFVSAHGKPGTFSLGDGQLVSQEFHRLTQKRLPDGTDLVFSSCALADRCLSWGESNENEYWVHVSEQLLSGEARAIAPTNILLTRPGLSLRNVAATVISLPERFIGITFGRGRPDYVQILYGVDSQYAGEGPGIRVFEADSRSVQHRIPVPQD